MILAKYSMSLLLTPTPGDLDVHHMDRLVISPISDVFFKKLYFGEIPVLEMCQFLQLLKNIMHPWLFL